MTPLKLLVALLLPTVNVGVADAIDCAGFAESRVDQLAKAVQAQNPVHIDIARGRRWGIWLAGFTQRGVLAAGWRSGVDRGVAGDSCWPGLGRKVAR